MEQDKQEGGQDGVRLAQRLRFDQCQLAIGDIQNSDAQQQQAINRDDGGMKEGVAKTAARGDRGQATSDESPPLDQNNSPDESQGGGNQHENQHDR